MFEVITGEGERGDTVLADGVFHILEYGFGVWDKRSGDKKVGFLRFCVRKDKLRELREKKVE